MTSAPSNRNAAIEAVRALRDTAASERAARARTLLEHWGRDPEIVSAVCASLLDPVRHRPVDERPLALELANLAAETAGACLEGLDDRARNDPERGGLLWINRANALRFCGADYDSQAQQAFERALELDGQRGWWWFDLGLLHKHRGRWQPALDCNLRARARLGSERAVLWNLAICATAQGDGDLAAGTWRQLGIPADVDGRSGMPVVEGIPEADVRVPTFGGPEAGGVSPDQASFEVVRVSPLSPCHGVVVTPTLRQAPVDYGDLILWDGAPVSVQARGNDKRPIFALLARLRPGDEYRFPFVATQGRAGALDRLAAELPDEAQLYVGDARIQWACARCTADHDAPVADEARPEDPVHGKIVASPSVSLEGVRQACEKALGRPQELALAVPGLYEALGDATTAARQHEVWRGLERRSPRDHSH